MRLVIAGALILLPSSVVRSQALPAAPHATCERTIDAHVIALEQVIFYNRFGSFNPSGLLFALARDVVDERGRSLEGRRPADMTSLAGNVHLRPDKRPRPIVLRANEGDCLHVVFTNLLSPTAHGQESVKNPATKFDVKKTKRPDIVVDFSDPATRYASMHVNGLNLVDGIESDGSNVGINRSSLVAPGRTTDYRWYAKNEGGYLLYSTGASVGGEGDGGQVGLGLFGSVNVEPRGATWYRSQVTAAELAAARIASSKPEVKRYKTPVLNYQATFPRGHIRAGEPILAMLEGHELIYTDINAVIDSDHESGCSHVGPGSECGRPYRKFTAIFHDEVTAVQAYPELEDQESPYSSIRDGMGINYGVSAMGPMVLAMKAGRGPAAKCTECKLEEFFLSSWANGDPAMILGARHDSAGNEIISGGHVALEAKYPDDPSNVHHSYIGDPVRFRNMHAGPKETHVFHLHAHQWLQDKRDPDSVYLDSQTLSPGASYTYDIHYGGSGNRNLTVGDSIFHCHLYPHFAQGMWALWRSHDVFEAGTPDRNLPDGEIVGGTPNPAVVPLPHAPLPPMPTKTFAGYPFYLGFHGLAGHRPPKPPLDLEGAEDRSTLQRHVILSAKARETVERPARMMKKRSDPACAAASLDADLYVRGQTNSACIAGRVHAENGRPDLLGLARELETAQVRVLPLSGTYAERCAMAFHAGVPQRFGSTTCAPPRVSVVVPPDAYGWQGRGYPTCDAEGACGKFFSRERPRTRARRTVRQPLSDDDDRRQKSPLRRSDAALSHRVRAARSYGEQNRLARSASAHHRAARRCRTHARGQTLGGTAILPRTFG